MEGRRSTVSRAKKLNKQAHNGETVSNPNCLFTILLYSLVIDSFRAVLITIIELN